MARKKKAFNDKIEDLNLVPIMNLVVCLIPMVLLGMSLVKIGFVNVNAPKFGMGAAAPEDTDEKPLNLTIAIAADGYRLTASGADINSIMGLPPLDPTDPAAAAAAAAAGPTIPKKGELYDYVDLYNKLVAIKKQFPNESIVNMTAERDTHFMYLIGTMDVMRVHLEAETYDDLDSFKAATPKYEDNQVALLWPDVVFAVAQ